MPVYSTVTVEFIEATYHNSLELIHHLYAAEFLVTSPKSSGWISGERPIHSFKALSRQQTKIITYIR